MNLVQDSVDIQNTFPEWRQRYLQDFTAGTAQINILVGSHMSHPNGGVVLRVPQ
jgi:hypothetical protein